MVSERCQDSCEPGMVTSTHLKSSRSTVTRASGAMLSVRNCADRAKICQEPLPPAAAGKESDLRFARRPTRHGVTLAASRSGMLTGQASSDTVHKAEESERVSFGQADRSRIAI